MGTTSKVDFQMCEQNCFREGLGCFSRSDVEIRVFAGEPLKFKMIALKISF